MTFNRSFEVLAHVNHRLAKSHPIIIDSYELLAHSCTTGSRGFLAEKNLIAVSWPPLGAQSEYSQNAVPTPGFIRLIC